VLLGIPALVIAAAVAAGAVVAGVLGPRLHRQRAAQGRVAPQRRPAQLSEGLSEGAATSPVEAKRRSGVSSLGSGPA
jgi:hypothetical protein